MIKKYTLAALEKAINHALALDENVPAKLAALQGKVIELIITPLDVHFFITFDQQKLILLDQCVKKPDTVIHSSPLGLIRLSFLPASKARSLFNDSVKLSGDTELGQQIKKLLDELDIDWEGHLASFTGDVVAFQLGTLFRKGMAFQRKLGNSFTHSLKDYLQEELRLFPPREEVEDFFKDIDQLTLDVDRLQVQIQLSRAH